MRSANKSENPGPWTLLLVMVLSLGIGIGPVHGVVTEVLVGGTLLLQTLTVVAELLPQVNALATNLFQLTRTGGELFGTLGELFGFPGGRTRPARAGSGPSRPSVEFEVPVIAPAARRSPGESGEPPEDDGRPEVEEPAGDELPAESDIVGKGDPMALLLETHRQRIGLLTGVGAREDPARLRRIEALSSLQDRFAARIAADMLTDFEAGRDASLVRFRRVALDGDRTDRQALRPALQEFLEKSRFLVLYDASRGDDPAYRALEELLARK